MLNVFQKKIVSYAITAFAIFVLGAFVALMFKLFGQFIDVFSFVLFPIAVAIIFSYALEPVVLWISRKMKDQNKTDYAQRLLFKMILGMFFPTQP